MVMIGRKWEELSHPNQYPVWNARILNVSSEEAVEGSEFCLKTSRTKLGRSKNLKTNSKVNKKGGGAMVEVERGGTIPSKPIPGMECSHFLPFQRRGGRVRILPKNVPYQARKVHEPENKYQSERKGGGGMVEVGQERAGANPPEPIHGSKSS